MRHTQFINGGVCAPIGFRASGIHCGIRKNKSKLDLGLIYCDTDCTAAAVYTTNKVFGAPISVTRRNLSNGKARAVICNSGNANTCNSDGVQKAEMMCQLTATALNISSSDIIVASTGVIGQELAIQPIADGMARLAGSISVDGSSLLATAIMTTDTSKKERAIEFFINDYKCHIGAVAKGSGMIHPNMATMLCFLTTDVSITTEMLQLALENVVRDTINMVSVDGDTSTNDMMSIMASGMANNTLISKPEQPEYTAFEQNLALIATEIAKMLARDGEGATKLVECHVCGADCADTARIIAKSVITSNLLKCALFAADANWGRILCAIGYAKADFDVSKIDVTLRSSAGIITVCNKGSGVAFDENYAHQILLDSTVIIGVDMHTGDGCAVAYGCDLTYDYVKINADYRS